METGLRFAEPLAGDDWTRIMKTLTLLIAITISLVGYSRDSQSATEAKGAADTVYTNGKIYTVNEAQPWAEAVAIKDGRFTIVGSNASVEAVTGDNTEVVDLEGQLVLPGLLDPHVHPSMDALFPTDSRLPGGFENPTFEAIEAKLRELANSATDDTEWITTFGHEKSTIPAERYNRQWLDAIFPDIPVFVEDQTGHGALVNSKALELAQITKDTPDPSGSRIIKDPVTGEPTGDLVEEGAIGMVRSILPAASNERRVEALRGNINELHENGITGFGDAKTLPAILEAWEIYFKEYGRQHHVTLYMHSIDSEGVDSVQRAKDLKSAFKSVDLPGVRLGAKIYADGSIEGQTALLLSPYKKRTDYVGTGTVPDDVFREVITDLDAAGIQIKIHAIGDGAVRNSLNAYEELINQRGNNSLRHHIDHLNLVSDEDIPRFAELGVPAGPYPLLAQPFAYQTSLIVPEIGEERWQAFTLPIRKLIEAGAMVGAKTDWSSTPVDPFLGIEVAITRQVPGQPELGTLGKDNAITLEQVIKCYTLNNAFILHVEDVAGSIEVGKQADMIVTSQNLFDIEPTQIHKTQVLTTVFKGEVVYKAE